MKLMRSTKFTVFHQLKAILHGSLVLRGRIISLFTICTGQSYNISHNYPIFTTMEPTTRIELVTSSLPRMCSTD